LYAIAKAFEEVARKLTNTPRRFKALKTQLDSDGAGARPEQNASARDCL